MTDHDWITLAPEDGDAAPVYRCDRCGEYLQGWLTVGEFRADQAIGECRGLAEHFAADLDDSGDYDDLANDYRGQVPISEPSSRSPVWRAVRAWFDVLAARLELTAARLREEARLWPDRQWWLGYGEGVEDGARREQARQRGELW